MLLDLWLHNNLNSLKHLLLYNSVIAANRIVVSGNSPEGFVLFLYVSVYPTFLNRLIILTVQIWSQISKLPNKNKFILLTANALNPNIRQ